MHSDHLFSDSSHTHTMLSRRVFSTDVDYSLSARAHTHADDETVHLHTRAHTHMIYRQTERETYAHTLLSPSPFDKVRLASD